MSEYFSALLGKRKAKADAIDSSFTSYVETNKEMNDFVIIERRPSPAHFTDVPGTSNAQGFPRSQKVESDYESLYSYVGQPSAGIPYQPFGSNWPYISSAQNMGAYPSKQAEMPFPEASRPASVISVKPIPQAEVISNHGDQSQVPDSPPIPSFLDGVPFRVSNLIATAQKVREMQYDSYNFLAMKFSLLESLKYDFNLEQDVLQADNLSVQNFE